MSRRTESTVEPKKVLWTGEVHETDPVAAGGGKGCDLGVMDGAVAAASGVCIAVFLRNLKRRLEMVHQPLIHEDSVVAQAKFVKALAGTKV